MSILSFKNKFPQLPDLQSLLNRGAIEAAVSNLLTNQFAIEVPSHIVKMEHLRGKQWASSFLWSFKLERSGVFGKIAGKDYALPAGYESWFPVFDLEDPMAMVDNYSVSTAFNTYNIPASTSSPSLKLSFIDDQSHTISRWFEDWMDAIFHKAENSEFGSGNIGIERGLLPLKQAARQIVYYKLNSKRTNITIKRYLVVPEGDLTFTGNSSSDILTYSISLNIVGKTEDVYPTDTTKRGKYGDKILELKETISSNLFGLNPFA